jgi:hypothetical protein
MNTKCGLVGMPNVGKSTTFNALTQSAIAAAENYPFCTIEPNIARVELKDERLERVARVVNAQRTVYVTLECHDIAGLVRDAHRGEGRGNSFLSHIQSVDIILHILRTFDDPDVLHVEEGSLNPKRDAQAIDHELILADLQRLEAIKQKTPIINQAIAHLNDLQPLRTALNLDLSLLKQYQLLSAKPIIYALNTGIDNHNTDPRIKYPDLREYLKDQEVVMFCADLEQQLASRRGDERTELMELYDITESGLDRVMRSVYRKLDLVTYITAGEKEARGWTVRRNTLAPKAASVIHSDFERLFICAEVVSYEDFVKHGGWVKSREAGVVKRKGRGDVILDGEVCLFRP